MAGSPSGGPPGPISGEADVDSGIFVETRKMTIPPLGGGDDGGDHGKKGGGLKRFLAGVAAAVVLFAGSGVGYYVGYSQKGSECLVERFYQEKTCMVDREALANQVRVYGDLTSAEGQKRILPVGLTIGDVTLPEDLKEKVAAAYQQGKVDGQKEAMSATGVAQPDLEALCKNLLTGAETKARQGYVSTDQCEQEKADDYSQGYDNGHTDGYTKGIDKAVLSPEKYSQALVDTDKDGTVDTSIQDLIDKRTPATVLATATPQNKDILCAEEVGAEAAKYAEWVPPSECISKADARSQAEDAAQRARKDETAKFTKRYVDYNNELAKYKGKVSGLENQVNELKENAECNQEDLQLHFATYERLKKAIDANNLGVLQNEVKAEYKNSSNGEAVVKMAGDIFDDMAILAKVLMEPSKLPEYSQYRQKFEQKINDAYHVGKGDVIEVQVKVKK